MSRVIDGILSLARAGETPLLILVLSRARYWTGGSSNGRGITNILHSFDADKRKHLFSYLINPFSELDLLSRIVFFAVLTKLSNIG